jgi:hypothetical protein
MRGTATHDSARVPPARAAFHRAPVHARGEVSLGLARRCCGRAALYWAVARVPTSGYGLSPGLPARVHGGAWLVSARLGTTRQGQRTARVVRRRRLSPDAAAPDPGLSRHGLPRHVPPWRGWSWVPSGVRWRFHRPGATHPRLGVAGPVMSPQGAGRGSIRSARRHGRADHAPGWSTLNGAGQCSARHGTARLHKGSTTPHRLSPGGAARGYGVASRGWARRGFTGVPPGQAVRHGPSGHVPGLG